MAVLQGVSRGDAAGTGPAGGGRSRGDEMPAPEARSEQTRDYHCMTCFLFLRPCQDTIKVQLGQGIWATGGRLGRNLPGCRSAQEMTDAGDLMTGPLDSAHAVGWDEGLDDSRE